MHLEKASGPDPKAWCAVEPELGAPLLVAVLDREVVAVRDRGVVVPRVREVVAVLDGEVVAALVLAAVDGEVVAALVLAAVDVEVVGLLTDATVGVFALPPHAATRITLASAAAAITRVRGGRVSRFGWILGCI